MINPIKEKKAIVVIHDLLIQLKIMSVNNKPHLEMYNFIDKLEYLPQLIIDDEDRTLIFDQCIEKLCEDHNLPLIIHRYKND